MKVFFQITCLAALVAAPAVASAQGAPEHPNAPPAEQYAVHYTTPARHYAHRSVGLLSQNEYLLVPAYSVLIADGNNVTGLFGLAATVRIVINHFLIQPHLGIGFGGVAFGAAAVNSVEINPGIGLGGVVVLAPHVALSPMGRANFFIAPRTGGPNTTVALMGFTGELPVSIFLGRNGFIEPYLGLGVLVNTTTTNVGGVVTTTSGAGFLLDVGYRLGVVF
jgi:hypothetical protein